MRGTDTPCTYRVSKTSGSDFAYKQLGNQIVISSFQNRQVRLVKKGFQGEISCTKVPQIVNLDATPESFIQIGTRRLEGSYNLEGQFNLTQPSIKLKIKHFHFDEVLIKHVIERLEIEKMVEVNPARFKVTDLPPLHNFVFTSGWNLFTLGGSSVSLIAVTLVAFLCCCPNLARRWCANCGGGGRDENNTITQIQHPHTRHEVIRLASAPHEILD